MNPDAVVGEVVQSLKEARNKAGITQRELAKKMGVSQAGLARMELEDHTPTLLFLVKVADALAVPLDEVLRDALSKNKK